MLDENRHNTGYPEDTQPRPLSQGSNEAPRPLARTKAFKHGLLLLLAIMAILTALTLIADHYQLDLRWTAPFYKSGQGWYLGRAQPWYALYKYGTLPGLVLAVGALFGFYFAYTRPRWMGLQRYFLLIALSIAIGPGLIVNSFFKEYWGRPRPKQTTVYGGQWEYRTVFSPGIPGRGKSFPCGHCTMGFAFLSLTVFWKRSRLLAWSGWLAGLSLGGLLGMARIVAGAHFPTDVLWSLGIVTMVIVVLYYWVLRIPHRHDAPVQYAALSHRGKLTLKLSAIGLIILLALLSLQPYYDSDILPFKIPKGTRIVTVHTNINFEKTNIRYRAGANPRIVIDTKGFSFPKAGHTIHTWQQQSGDTLHLYYEVQRKGYFAKLKYRCEVILPLEFKNNLEVNLNAPL